MPRPTSRAQPANGSGFAAAPAINSSTVHGRPFIPHSAIGQFDGSGTLAERRKWVELYLYTGSFGWTDEERCINLRLFLTGAAEYWYDQLSRAVRRNWEELLEAFRLEFCRSRESPAERYYDAKQKRHESPRDYLWRYNALAKKARIPLVSPSDLRPHVNRFVRTLSDANTRQDLSGRSFASVKELDDTLVDLEDQLNQVSSSYSRSRSRSEERDRSQSRASARVYYVYDSDGERELVQKMPRSRPSVHFQDSASDESGEEQVDRRGLVYQAVTDKSRDRSRPSQSSSDWRASRSSSPRPGPRDPSPARDDSKCFECGGTGHWARDCPNRVVCILCKQPGHASDKCWKQCPACAKVHAQGQCEIVRTLEGLKSWSKSAENQTAAGTMPAAAQQYLN